VPDTDTLLRLLDSLCPAPVPVKTRPRAPRPLAMHASPALSAETATATETGADVEVGAGAGAWATTGSGEGLFTYRASDRAWSGKSKVDLSRAPHDIVTLSAANVAAEVFSDSGTGPYYYLSYVINRPETHPFVRQVAPYLLRLGGSAALAPQMRLWISSEGAVATWHYDMERNFFVQLAGNKRFLLANADAYLFLQPKSFLHPGWRQAAHGDILSAADLIDLALAYVGDSLPGALACSGRDIMSANHHRLNPICKYRDMIAADPSKNQRDIVASLFGIKEVTLLAGDVLHLPPFVFHCVMSGQSSASLNVWLGSSELSIATKLQNIPLPWVGTASLAQKIKAIRFSIMRYFSLLGHSGLYGIEYALFVSALESRYAELAQSEGAVFCAATTDGTLRTTNIETNTNICPDKSESCVCNEDTASKAANAESSETQGESCSRSLPLSLLADIQRGMFYALGHVNFLLFFFVIMGFFFSFFFLYQFISGLTKVMTTLSKNQAQFCTFS
jgi:hypothetical protein